MKRVLEALVVVAALALAATVAYQFRARLAARAEVRAASAPGARPGSDVEPTAAAAPLAPRDRSVTSLPPIKMSVPPRRARRADPPPPAPR